VDTADLALHQWQEVLPDRLQEVRGAA